MYIYVSSLKNVKPGDAVVLEKEFDFGEISVREIGGDIIGFVLRRQPEGCVDFLSALKNIGSKKIIAVVAVSLGGTLLLHSESTSLLNTVRGDIFKTYALV